MQKQKNVGALDERRRRERCTVSGKWAVGRVQQEWESFGRESPESGTAWEVTGGTDLGDRAGEWWEESSEQCRCREWQ